MCYKSVARPYFGYKLINLFPNFRCKPFCGGPSRFSRILIGKSSCFEKIRLEYEVNSNHERNRVAGASFNETRISGVLGQTREQDGEGAFFSLGR